MQYPVALPRRGRGHRRDPGPARAAGGRHAERHSRLQHSRHLRRGRARRGARAGAAVRRDRNRHAGGPARASNRDDRPGDRSRFRRCHLAFARRKGALEPWRSISPTSLTSFPRDRRWTASREDPGHERLPAGPRDPHASRDPLEQPGQPPGRPNPIYRERASGFQPRGHLDRRSDSRDRRSRSTIAFLTSRHCRS